MNKLNNIPPPLDTGIIIICEKCGVKGLETTAGTNPSHYLQAELKERIKNTLPKGKIKAVLSGCLSICPQQQISIAIIGTHDGKVSFYTCEKTDMESTADKILKIACNK